MIIPSIFPGELDRSYLGKLMHCNGVASKTKMVEQLLEWAKLPREVPLVLPLSMAAGMSLSDFVRRHTLLPFRRAITSYLPDLTHGCESNPKLVRYSATRLARPGAFFCKFCVDEDLHFHGVSTWRREHQIPGRFWCEKHDADLHYRQEEEAFLFCPDQFTNNCYCVSYPWMDEARDNPAVQRFLSICSGLLDRAMPVSVGSVALPVLRSRASRLGFQTYPGKVRHRLLSDVVIGAFGREWLATVLPPLAHKKDGEWSNRMDGVLFMSKSASCTAAYVLALAILFDTPEEALNALFQGSKAIGRARRENRTLDSNELQQAYIKVKGSYARVAEMLQTSYSAVGRRLRDMGLPNLTGRLEVAVEAFLVSGYSTAESAHLGRIDAIQMDELLRTIGTAFLAVYREFNGQPKTGLGSGCHRPLRLAPHEVTSS